MKELQKEINKKIIDNQGILFFGEIESDADFRPWLSLMEEIESQNKNGYPDHFKRFIGSTITFKAIKKELIESSPLYYSDKYQPWSQKLQDDFRERIKGLANSQNLSFFEFYEDPRDSNVIIFKIIQRKPGYEYIVEGERL